MQGKQLYSSVHSTKISRKRHIILPESHLNWFYADEEQVNLDNAVRAHAEHLLSWLFRGGSDC